MLTLGAIFRPQLPPERLCDVVQAAERAGLPELWVWEDCFFGSGVATASAALALTQQLRVGIGAMPAPLRQVALTAMEAATLHRMFPGRAVIGVGHGVQDWMGQAGARVESPMTLMREYLDALRALLRGDRVTTKGRYVTLDDVALEWPPATVPPVLVAAAGPKSLHLSGAAADGTILSAGTTPDAVRRARGLIDSGRDDAGRTDHHQLVVNLHAATGPGAEARLEAELEYWYRRPAPELGVAGDAEAVAAAVRALGEAGADTVVLQPTPDEPDPEGFVRFTAEAVRPLL